MHRICIIVPSQMYRDFMDSRFIILHVVESVRNKDCIRIYIYGMRHEFAVLKCWKWSQCKVLYYFMMSRHLSWHSYGNIYYLPGQLMWNQGLDIEWARLYVLWITWDHSQRLVKSYFVLFSLHQNYLFPQLAFIKHLSTQMDSASFQDTSIICRCCLEGKIDTSG